MLKSHNTIIKILFSVVLVAFLQSCLSVKDVRYLQPSKNLILNEDGYIPYNVPKYRITKNDVLKLNIITTPKGDAAQFYSSLNASSGVGGGDGSFYFSGLKLNDEGEIYVFGMGLIKAEGRTTDEIAKEIQDRVNENFLPYKSEVRLSLEGIKYTLITDVGGKNTVKTTAVKTLTMIDLLAENGGLDKSVDRKNIIIYRKFPEGMKKAVIDVTKDDVMNSPYFYVQNNDMIVLNTRARNLNGFGNEPIQTLTTGISLVTTALSIYYLITRL